MVNNKDVIDIEKNLVIIIIDVVRPHLCLVPEVSIIQIWFIT